MIRGNRIGSKANVLSNLRAILRLIRKRNSYDSISHCESSQYVLSQVSKSFVCQKSNYSNNLSLEEGNMKRIVQKYELIDPKQLTYLMY